MTVLLLVNIPKKMCQRSKIRFLGTKNRPKVSYNIMSTEFQLFKKLHESGR